MSYELNPAKTFSFGYFLYTLYFILTTYFTIFNSLNNFSSSLLL